METFQKPCFSSKAHPATFPLAAQSNVPVKEENEFIVMMTHYFLFLKLQEIKQISKFKSFQNLSSSI
jgi:hypothetical protein